MYVVYREDILICSSIPSASATGDDSGGSRWSIIVLLQDRFSTEARNRQSLALKTISEWSFPELDRDFHIAIVYLVRRLIYIYPSFFFFVG